jgi:hypothetical protein
MFFITAHLIFFFILLSNPLSSNMNMGCTFNTQDQDLQPYKTTNVGRVA